ncbi:MAG: 30S ribosome-binding factor RbfA [Epsilonproteobacteria bacterium]|nr:MAG: 30S ribosome-binding factor RbfA [Campylobacterota bacterium]
MKSLNILKAQSLLMELVPEALSQLSDERINSLNILEIDCKNGKYDANVYFDSGSIPKNDINDTIKQLKKANGFIRSYCLSATSWYRCPNFTFKSKNFDENISNINTLFEKISKKDKNGV